MAKEAPFKAYDLDRRNLHKIPSPPVMINRHRIANKREWEDVIAKRRGIRLTRNTRVKLPSVAQILKADENDTCYHCKLETKECAGTECYRQYSKDNFPADLVDIKGPGPLGYSAYTKPGVNIKKHQIVGEYIGELRPQELGINSMYQFIVPGKCALDSKDAGNWTRFINSHCRPNLGCHTVVVGRRSVILFQALRNIGEEEELTFRYGEEDYFKPAGFACKCSWCEKGKKRKKARKIIDAL